MSCQISYDWYILLLGIWYIHILIKFQQKQQYTFNCIQAKLKLFRIINTHLKLNFILQLLVLWFILVFSQKNKSPYAAVAMQYTYRYLVYIHFYNIFLSFSVLPLYVHIDSVKEPLSAERVYDIHCISFGSRPSALVTWWSGMTQLLDHSSQVKWNFIK